MTNSEALPVRPHNTKLHYRLVNFCLRVILRRVRPSQFMEGIALRWGFAYRPRAGIVKLRNGLSMKVDPADYLQLLLYYLGTFEPHCLKYLPALLSRGGTFVDVGANIGVYSLEGALIVGAEGRVIAIEAAPPHISTLGENIRLNQLENVTICPVGVGAEKRVAHINVPQGGNLGMFTVGGPPTDQGFDIHISPLDDVLGEEGIDNVQLIKMDVEGSEYDALRGAPRLLQEIRPTILIEINETALRGCSASAVELVALLVGHNYLGWRINRNGISRLQTGSSFNCEECLFVHRDNALHLEIVANLASPNG